MKSNRSFRSILSLVLTASFVLSALAFGSVTGARAEEPTPPAPEGVIIDPNIVGGQAADPGEWPWQVALVRTSDYYNSQFCGGSLVAPQWVVTAAHCVDGETINSIDVVAGIYNLQTHPGAQKRDVAQIIKHPNYSPSTSNNDIALIKLSTPVTIGGTGESKTAAVPLVPSSVGDLTGVNSWVTGWGNTESFPEWPTQLMEVQVPIISNTDCGNAYPGQITSSMMCAGFAAGGKDSCQGDSGGPLVVDVGSGWQLAGVVSWGDGCADPNAYGVYTRVSVFTAWINSYIISGPTQSTLTARSTGSYDGWTLESGEFSGVGGSYNATNSLLYVGDNAANRQYRGILSFDTSSIPDNATITSVTFKVRHGGVSGTNPFTTHGNLLVDIVTGAFGGSNSLSATDFEAASSLDGVMILPTTPTSGWYSTTLPSGNFNLINLAGVTQLRLRFSTDDNNDGGVDILKLYTGNALTSYRPQLIIVYTTP